MIGRYLFLRRWLAVRSVVGFRPDFRREFLGLASESTALHDGLPSSDRYGLRCNGTVGYGASPPSRQWPALWPIALVAGRPSIGGTPPTEAAEAGAGQGEPDLTYDLMDRHVPLAAAGVLAITIPVGTKTPALGAAGCITSEWAACAPAVGPVERRASLRTPSGGGGPGRGGAQGANSVIECGAGRLFREGGATPLLDPPPQGYVDSHIWEPRCGSPSPALLGKVARSAGWGVASRSRRRSARTNGAANLNRSRPAFRTPSAASTAPSPLRGEGGPADRLVFSMTCVNVVADKGRRRGRTIPA